MWWVFLEGDVFPFVAGSFAHGFTYSGHPVACAVAIEALKIYRYAWPFCNMIQCSNTYLSYISLVPDERIAKMASAKGIFRAMSGRLLQSFRMELGHLQTVQLSGRCVSLFLNCQTYPEARGSSCSNTWLQCSCTADTWLRDDNGNWIHQQQVTKWSIPCWMG